jgi:hypothetical protein
MNVCRLECISCPLFVARVLQDSSPRLRCLCADGPTLVSFVACVQ